MEVGEKEIIYLSRHCHHQNDFCVKMGSDESHFNVSLIVRDKVTRQCPQTTFFEEKGEPKRIRTEVPLLTSLTTRPNRLTSRGCTSGGVYIPCIYMSGESYRRRHRSSWLLYFCYVCRALINSLPC